MAEGYSTENLSVTEVFMAGHLTAEWIRKAGSTTMSADQFVEAYQNIIDAIRQAPAGTRRERGS